MIFMMLFSLTSSGEVVLIHLSACAFGLDVASAFRGLFSYISPDRVPEEPGSAWDLCDVGTICFF